jgi:hypothetical protein
MDATSRDAGKAVQGNQAATKPKVGGVEDAHFRIDEMERRLASMPSEDHIAGIATGVAHAAGQGMLEHIRKLTEAQDQDVKTDREVIEGLRDLIAELKGLSAQLCQVLTQVASARPRD